MNYLSLLDGLAVSFNDANKHTIIFGKPGSGKSLFFSSLLRELEAKQLKFIVFDLKNSFIKNHYNPSIHRHNSPSNEELSIEAMKLWFRDPTKQFTGLFISGQTSEYYLKSAIQYICSLSDYSDLPVHFVLDDTAFLQLSYDSLIALLTQGRSKGANIWLSYQSYYQLIQQYDNNSRSILSVIQNYCSFAIGDDVTASLLQTKLPGISSNELSNLPALSGYAKFGKDSTISFKVPFKC